MRNNDIPKIIESTLRVMQMGYYFWFIVYVALGVLSVILPGLAAIGLWSGDTSKYLAGAGALAAAVFAFLRPHEYASGFDAATQAVWKTQIAHDLGQIGEKEISEELRRAVEITTFKYGGLAIASTQPENRPAGHADAVVDRDDDRRTRG
jgi:hypothetical protein